MPGEEEKKISENCGPTSSVTSVDNSPEERRARVPDGGWGWCVLFGTVVVNFCIPGLMKSFGILFVEFLEIFHVGPASSASWIPAVSYCFYNSMGLLSAVLCEKFSCRAVALVGGIITSVGLLASAFAKSIAYLIISFGFVTGCGAGLTYPTGLLVIAQYFRRRQGLAIGICLAGSAFGGVFMPPFLRYLLATYGLRGSILILSGVMLHVLLAALLYRPVNRYKGKEVDAGKGGEDGIQETIVQLHETTSEGNLALATSTSTSIGTPSLVEESKSKATMSVSASSGTVKVIYSNKSALAPECHASPSAPSNKTSLLIFSDAPSLMLIRSRGSLLVEKKESEVAPVQVKKKASTTLIHCSVLRDPVYVIFQLTSLANSFVGSNFILFLPAYANMELGLEKTQASLFLSVVAACDFVGRIAGASLSDVLPLPRRYYFVFGVLCSSLGLLCLSYTSTSTGLAIACGCIGLSTGTHVGVSCLVQQEQVGIERLGSAVGINLFLHSPMQLVGPPLLGYLLSCSRSFRPLFRLLSVVQMTGATLWVLVPLIEDNHIKVKNGD